MNNSIRKYFEEEGFEICKRAEILGKISSALRTIAVSGTHGKTTISAMIAYLLKENGLKINAFLGGISSDYGSNLLIDDQAEIMVTEADEFDRSFLQLHPDTAVISSVDADHLDIYGEKAEMLKSYAEFVFQIREGGQFYTRPEVMEQLELSTEREVKLYGLQGDQLNVKAKGLKVEQGKYSFQLVIEEQIYPDFSCGLPGIHNVENALVALAIAHKEGIGIDQLRKSIGSFSGVKRRFDVHIKNDELIYIDDYAHHPEEIRRLLQSVRELYPGKKVTTIFQPHLYSRTRDLGDDFAQVLGDSDELILLELYPAREEPIDEISSLWLSRKIKKTNVPVCQKSQLMNILKERDPEVLLTVGAGDIDEMVQPIIDYYS